MITCAAFLLDFVDNGMWSESTL